MDKNYFIKKLFNSKIQDYSSAIAFFLIFSFFVYFVIRPNLLAIVTSLRKIEELKTMDSFYDTQVKKILDLQANLESIRDDYTYINAAMPVYPEVNKVFSDIKGLLEKNGLLIESISFDNINLKDNQTAKTAKVLKMHIGAAGDFTNIKDFLNELNAQLRLKKVTEMTIFKEKNTASESSRLKINLVIDSFYL